MQNKLSQPVAALIVIVMIVVATAGVSMISDKPTQEPLYSNSNEATAPKQTTTNNSQVSKAAFKDGIYSSDGRYSTPGGNESIGITVTLKGGIIEDINLEQRATGGDTEIYQRKFASQYKESVVGKNIEEVKLTRVAGSSLTSNGFNDALESIKRDAAG